MDRLQTKTIRDKYDLIFMPLNVFFIIRVYLFSKVRRNPPSLSIAVDLFELSWTFCDNHVAKILFPTGITEKRVKEGREECIPAGPSFHL